MNALRFPYPPLRERAARNAYPRYVPGLRPDSPRSVSAVLGVPEHRIRRIWTPKGLTLPEADSAATVLGTHPSDIWPVEWERHERLILLPEPAKVCPCCRCKQCGPPDRLATTGCDPWCLPCTFEVCGCPSSHDLS